MLVKKTLRQGQRLKEQRKNTSMVAARVEGMVVASVYAPPHLQQKKEASAMILEQLEQKWKQYSDIVLLGDWNTDTDKQEINDTERMMAQRRETRVVKPNGPTRWDSDICVDYVITTMGSRERGGSK